MEITVLCNMNLVFYCIIGNHQPGYSNTTRVEAHKILNTLVFQFSTKILFIRAGIHEMLVRIANGEDPLSVLFVNAFLPGNYCMKFWNIYCSYNALPRNIGRAL